MHVLRGAFVILLVVASSHYRAQTDSLFLMNGHVFSAQILDTSSHSVKIQNTQKPSKPLEYGADQLYKIRFSSGADVYYYQKDSLVGNWLTRSEMWLYM